MKSIKTIVFQNGSTSVNTLDFVIPHVKMCCHVIRTARIFHKREDMKNVVPPSSGQYKNALFLSIQSKNLAKTSCH